MRKIKSLKLKTISQPLNFLVFPLLILFLSSCSESHKERTANELPLIGNYDVVLAPMEGYEIGDTIFHTVSNWKYLTQDSTFLTSSDVDDKIWIADFFFASCPTICVPMNESLDRIRDSLNKVTKDIAYLSFSIDPEKDTPERLREYRKEHNFTGNNWHFLTGDQEKTKQMALDEFQILAQEDKTAPGGFMHSPNFVLVDKDKHIRGIYNSLEEDDCQRLINDVKLLVHGK